jgi:hypothetical protein
VRRLVAGAICVAVIVAAYVAASVALIGNPPPAEQRFTRPAETGETLQVYAEVLSFDPMRDALDVRLDFATASSQLGSRFAGVADRDMTVQVADGDVDRQITLRRGEVMAPVPATISIRRGRIDAYPFDRYKIQLVIDAHEAGGPPAARPVPLRVTIWSRLASWDIRMAQAERPISPSAIDLDILVRRSGTIRFFAVTLYAAMALIGCAGIMIGLLIVTRVRRADTTMAGVLSAMTFSLPALRNVLPGAPPLGIWADSLVFLWAEVAVVVGLTLVVITWARHGEVGSRSDAP